MPRTESLLDAFVAQLHNVYDVEAQVAKSLRLLAKVATSKLLSALFTRHMEETYVQLERLDDVFALIDRKSKRRHSVAMAGILVEARLAMEEGFDAVSTDARLIACAQRVDHYEIAVYRTLIAWANALDLNNAASVLQLSLDEEQAMTYWLAAEADASTGRRKTRVAVQRSEAAEERDEGA